MADLVVKRALEPGDVAAVQVLVAIAAAHDGHPPLDDHHRLELVHGGRPGFAAFAHWEDGVDHPVAYAQLSRGNDAWTVQLVVDPRRRPDVAPLASELLDAVLATVRADGGGPLYWWVVDPTPAHHAVADRLGLREGRQLHQLRRPLPTGITTTIATRAFRPGEDEAAWLHVNNRAFAGHPEQGAWVLATLRAREAEPWFTPEGFRLYEDDDDGRLLGFCWTKVHADHDPLLGEIYVIGVDPSAHGRGLGRQLTLAGLDSLAGRGVPVAMLYVDAANAAALALYGALGFALRHTQSAFVGEV